MRLVGASFAGEGPRDFDGIVMQATALLRGDGLARPEAEALRDTLIQGYRWLLVDEYQDIGPEEYALIGAVAGRSQADPDLRISLFAVGDDDQNIYAFAGANIDFIRRFEADYAARPVWLTENYRSTAHIIAAANAVIAPAAGRMKAGHDITLNRARAKAPPGGVMSALDSVAQGRVSLLDAGPTDAAQAVAALDELLRLSRLDPDWSWRRCAVIARDWRRLEPVRAYAETLGIPIDMANVTLPGLWRLREMQAFIRTMLVDRTRLLTVSDLTDILNAQERTPWTDLIGEGIGTLARELVEKAAPVPDLVQWFGEWARDVRGEQQGLLLLTAHRAKGLEFDHVAILNGGWDRPSRGEDPDAPRRLFYVAMTRAKSSLTILTDGPHAFVQLENAILPRRVTPDTATLPRARLRYMPPDPKLVDLSYAGRLKAGHPALAAITAAIPGDPVQLIRDGDRWRIENTQGQTLARLSRAFTPPEDATFLRGEVSAILRWRREDGAEDFHHFLRRDEWEVVLPELVFEGGG
jgi:ATP-dependent DNA helicase RecQ